MARYFDYHTSAGGRAAAAAGGRQGATGNPRPVNRPSATQQGATRAGATHFVRTRAASRHPRGRGQNTHFVRTRAASRKPIIIIIIIVGRSYGVPSSVTSSGSVGCPVVRVRPPIMMIMGFRLAARVRAFARIAPARAGVGLLPVCGLTPALPPPAWLPAAWLWRASPAGGARRPLPASCCCCCPASCGLLRSVRCLCALCVAFCPPPVGGGPWGR